MPASSPLYTEAKARPRRSTATDPEIMASAATVAAPAPTPWSERSPMAAEASMGRRKAKLAAP